MYLENQRGGVKMTKLIKNNIFIWLTVLVVIGGIVSGSVLATGGYGADEAKKLEDYTLEDMLTYAIEDEYLARAEYEAIMKEYGEQKPFSNIIKAEKNHIEELMPLFNTYNIVISENDAKEHVVVPASIEEALAIGVQAEIDNIAMYEMFLEQDIPQDVRDIFTNLKKASEKHLAAFERGVERGQNQGQNYGFQYGKKQGAQGVSKGQGAGREVSNNQGRYNKGQGQGRNNKANEEDECDCEDCEEMSKGIKSFKNNEQNFGK